MRGIHAQVQVAQGPRVMQVALGTMAEQEGLGPREAFPSWPCRHGLAWPLWPGKDSDTGLERTRMLLFL